MPSPTSNENESPDEESDPASSEDVFKILITTDNHLGFAERDDERASDSLIAFEECLQIARDENVDFILLGGDLFHDNKPSNHILLECINLLRKYCLGDKTIGFKLISDEKINFSSTVQSNPFPWANFKDPNLNVSTPVFSIHGNHDDPAGSTPLCPLDLLNSCGLVNYFGNLSSLENIDIHPLLFRKGETNLAIYGLGSIRDERLHRIFLKNQINLLRPTNNPDDWFNIFVIHQNRVAHGPKNYIPEQFLHEFLDIVIWGHEHDCRITPEFNTVQKFFVIQPGSTVATSLSEGEQLQKHAGILHVYKKTFKMHRRPLQTVRQFYFLDIQLTDHIDEKALKTLSNAKLEQKLDKILTDTINELLLRAQNEHSGHPKQPKKPLIRLRVDYTGFDIFDSFNDIRFVQKFSDQVANPKTMINLHKKRESNAFKTNEIKLDPNAIKISNEQFHQAQRVEDSIQAYFESASEANRLRLLDEKSMLAALTEFIDKDEVYALSTMVEAQIEQSQKFLSSNIYNDDVAALEDELKRFKALQNVDDEEAIKRRKDLLVIARQERIKAYGDKSSDDEIMVTQSIGISNDNSDDDDGDDDFDQSSMRSTQKRTQPSLSTARGATRGRGRGRAKATPTKAPRGKKKPF
ncbi:unnamed protein product [Rotaria socialis]|uniref:Double-strand break repair protein n=1 Tax=Rotaria socialis TaxID=392032 RepID=A0A819ZH83_9BILA|nr:unnamed protein product [Rotaria socialis]CAF3443608.1 unnamed protein product [Rotaria socialis]CAF3544772.1 unnamed protein product [Rotaria socialis]CAF3619518.1 unnamed protein product [Rotaria socialis]CAF4169919.1 unnamed protein product [Rotaria socialis]